MNDMITFYPVSRPLLAGRELEYVTHAVKSGWISLLGGYVSQFEEEFAAFCGVKHAICVTNGTVALHLAQVAQEIGPGDEVIMPDLSFIATANATLLTGARPVFCDIDADNLCIDPKALEALITPRTTASVVSGKLPPNILAAGNPSRIIKRELHPGWLPDVDT